MVSFSLLVPFLSSSFLLFSGFFLPPASPILSSNGTHFSREKSTDMACRISLSSSIPFSLLLSSKSSLPFFLSALPIIFLSKPLPLVFLPLFLTQHSFLSVDNPLCSLLSLPLPPSRLISSSPALYRPLKSPVLSFRLVSFTLIPFSDSFPTPFLLSSAKLKGK